jgi:hypothetical protein
MSDKQLVARADPDRALISEVAMDIGKDAVSHVRIMYPQAFAALGPSGQRSLRNQVYNGIMAALNVVDADEIRRRLDARKSHRRHMHKAYDALRANIGTPEASHD